VCVYVLCCAVQVLTELQDALAAYVAMPAQRAHFLCNPAVTWRALEDPLKLRLSVGVTYSFTGASGRLPGQLQHQPLTCIQVACGALRLLGIATASVRNVCGVCCGDAPNRSWSFLEQLLARTL
jgi:hypothetical protein